MSNLVVQPDTHILRLSYLDMTYTPAWTLDEQAFTPVQTNDDQAPSIQGLEVEIDTSHIGYVNKNFKFYVPADARAAAKTFVTPYNKPVLRHHAGSPGLFSGATEYTDPIGRVVEAKVVKLVDKMVNEPLPDNEPQGVVRVVARIGDYESARKILDGRYNTVSVSAAPASVICSICHQELLFSTKKKKGEEEEEECSHYPGKVYDGKMCYFFYGKYAYGELSFVNFPADEYAGTVAIRGEDSCNDCDIRLRTNMATVCQSRIHVLHGATCIDRKRVIVSVADTKNKNNDDISGDDMDELKKLEGELKEAKESLKQVETERDSLKTELEERKGKVEELVSEVDNLKKALDESVAAQRSSATDSLILLRTINGAYGKTEDEVKQSSNEARKRLEEQNLDTLQGMLAEELKASNLKIDKLTTQKCPEDGEVSATIGDTDTDEKGKVGAGQQEVVEDDKTKEDEVNVKPDVGSFLQKQGFKPVGS